MATKQSKPTNINQTIGMVTILLLMAAFGSTYYFFMPSLLEKRATLETTKAQLEAVQTDVTTLRTTGERITKAQAALQKAPYNVDFSKAAIVYPKVEDVPGFYLQMERLVSEVAALPGSSGNTFGLKYQVGQPTGVADPANPIAVSSVTIPVTVSINATYPRFLEVVSLMETAARPITITQFSLSRPDPSIPSVSDAAKATLPAEVFTITASGYVRAEGFSPAYAASKTVN